MALWWFTEAVPITVTACLPLGLFPALGVYGKPLPQELVFAVEPFVDAYIFLFMGGMAIGAAMEEWGLHRRVALGILKAVGTEPRRLLWGVLLATGLVSAWISNTATAVMMLPIAMALLKQLEASGGGRRLSGFGAALMLAVAYAANVGGVITKIGSGTNSIFVGFLSDELGYELSFLRYIAVGLPFAALFMPLVWWALWRMARVDAPSGALGREVLDKELSAMGLISTPERKVAAVFFAAAGLWVFGDLLRGPIASLLSGGAPGFKLLGKHYEAGVAMVAAFALLVAGVLPLRALKRVPWGTLLLLGGSFAMAAGLEGSGLAGWLARKLGFISQLPLLAQLLLASTATIGLSAIASNTATINLLLNMLPRSPTILAVAALGASCDFALPAGTPPNAIVFGSGYVRLPQMMRVGFALDLLAALLLGLYGLGYLGLVLPAGG